MDFQDHKQEILPLTIKKRVLSKKAKLTEEYVEFITNFYKDQTNIGKTVDDLFLLLVETFDLNYDYVNLSTIYRKLDELNYSYKKISHVKKECNSDRIKTKRYNIAKTLLFCFDKRYHMIYLDESGFNIYMTTRYHYAPKGDRISADMEKKSSNYSYIGAIDYLGLIGFMIFKGSVKQEDFFGFLCLLLQRIEDNTSTTNFVFFMDNARTHHSKNR